MHSPRALVNVAFVRAAVVLGGAIVTTASKQQQFVPLYFDRSTRGIHPQAVAAVCVVVFLSMISRTGRSLKLSCIIPVYYYKYSYVCCRSSPTAGGYLYLSSICVWVC